MASDSVAISDCPVTERQEIAASLSLLAMTWCK